MNARITTAIVACTLLLSGCGGQTAVVKQDTGTFEPVMRYRGTLGCTDCTAINADLSLYQDAETGEPKGYVLSETHLDAPGGEFTSSSWGSWSKDMFARPVLYRLSDRSAKGGSKRSFELRDNALVPAEEGEKAQSHALTRIAPLAPVK